MPVRPVRHVGVRVVVLVSLIGLAGCGGESTPTPPSSITPAPVTSIYSGSFSGEFQTAFTHQRTGFVCRDTMRINGTVTMTLTQQTPTVAGTAAWSGTHATTATTCPLGVIGSNPWSGGGLTVSGTSDRIAFTQEVRATNPSGTGESTDRTFMRTFSGALSGSAITGTITFSERHVNASEIGEGSVAMAVTATLR